MLFSGLVSRSIDISLTTDRKITVKDCTFAEIENKKTNGGAFLAQKNGISISFEGSHFINCSTVSEKSCGGAIYIDCPYSTFSSKKVSFQKCSASEGQCFYLSIMDKAVFQHTQITKITKNSLTTQNSVFESHVSRFSMKNLNETGNTIKGEVSCAKISATASKWKHCAFINNSCNNLAFYSDNGDHTAKKIIFLNNTQSAAGPVVLLLGNSRITGKNVNGETFDLAAAKKTAQPKLMNRVILEDPTYFDKDNFYKGREEVDEPINMKIVYISVPIVCLAIFIIGFVWYYIAKLCLPNHYNMNNVDNSDDDIINDPKFNDDRYFIDRSSAQIEDKPEVETGIATVRRKHLITFSDGEEEDQYYSDDPKNPEGGKGKNGNSKSNNPLWAASLMNDTDDPFQNDFEEDHGTRLYKKGTKVAPEFFIN